MKLLIVQRIFSHYRKPVFDRLADIFNLRLLHANNKSGIKQETASYSKTVPAWKFGNGETNIFLWLFSELFRFKPKVVIHEMALGMPTMFLLLWLRKLLGFKYIVWGHGYDRKIGFKPGKRKGDKIRRYVLKNADAVLLYDYDTKKLLSRYINKNKMFVAPNTLDTDKLICISKQLEQKGKAIILRELNWNKKYNLVYIGRLLPSKHPGKLFEIVKYLPEEVQKEVAIHIIGSGSEKEKLEVQAKSLSKTIDANFYGAIHNDNQSGMMLFAADLMIIPGAVGLSVNHAFAFNCPVATFSASEYAPKHGPEITYVVHKQTGILAPAFNCELMAQGIVEYLSNSNYQQNMRTNAGNLIESNASIAKMIEGFKLVADYVNRDR